MIRQLLILFLFPVLLRAQKINDFIQLFYSLKMLQVTWGDETRIKQRLARKTIGYSELYPDINY